MLMGKAMDKQMLSYDGLYTVYMQFVMSNIRCITSLH